ncbi:uroporphyrinogen-III synthase [Microbacteriaceae bacterium 4G12]
MSDSLKQTTILITRAKAQAASMARAIRERGGIPLEIPLLHIVPTECTDTLGRSLEQIGDYTWIIFTSKNAVDCFFHYNKSLPASLKVAAVGTKTKQALEQYGYTVHFVPSEFVAETFVKEFIPLVQEGERIIFPKGNLARDVISSALLERGVFVDEFVVYETKSNENVQGELIAALQGEEVDVITFASPSAVWSFVSLLEGTNWRQWVKKCTIACIGPITEQVALQFFSHVLAPQEYTIEGLLGCIEEFRELKR